MSEGLDPILQQKEQQQLKTQLLWRLGIAGGLIAAILFGIAWLEKSQENAAPNLQIPQIAPELNASEAAEVASSVASAVASASPNPSPTANPTASAVIAITSTPSPVATAVITTSLPATKIQKIENIPQAIPTPRIEPKANKTIIATAIPLAKPLPTAEPQPATPNTTNSPIISKPALAYPAPVNSTRGYSVQAGVFLLSNNAEKLLGQLQQAGIPAYLETRVQIGPFKTKAEADAAVKKLKALGITPVVKTE
ncbi:SPOR domain-containing protein [Chitinibacter bivalviorum]|uniref:SPOR domain-containing protein n=1 Tax=Chitinibacter bivalviorum TaxID=2739434 RepID=A0A7H9BI97_9NEIS|nr:SPOR domain-containing protein [Chitinibacter bivalviorum]QLG87928.1 SPOR domain-containing protein [Chitinibacter bivalviorum]